MTAAEFHTIDRQFVPIGFFYIKLVQNLMDFVSCRFLDIRTCQRDQRTGGTLVLPAAKVLTLNQTVCRRAPVGKRRRVLATKTFTVYTSETLHTTQDLMVIFFRFFKQMNTSKDPFLRALAPPVGAEVSF